MIFLLNLLDEKEKENTYLTSKYLTFYSKYAIIFIENERERKIKSSLIYGFGSVMVQARQSVELIEGVQISSLAPIERRTI